MDSFGLPLLGSRKSAVLLESLRLPNVSIFNISKVALSPQEEIVLGLGLKFLPSIQLPTIALRSSLKTSVDDFIRRLRVQLFFAFEPTRSSLIPRMESKGYEMICPEVDHYLDQYKESSYGFLDSACLRQPNRPLDRLLRNAIQQLIDSPFIYKPADKNLGVCVLSKSHYHAICLTHLNDRGTYQLLHTVDAKTFSDIYCLLKSILSDAGYLYISKRNRSGSASQCYHPLAASILQLETSVHLRVGRFYCLPKMHKTIEAGCLPPGRPIVSSIKTATYHCSRYLHNYLMRVVKRLPTICSSSIQALLAIEDLKITDDMVILCADVANLYPSIPLEYGLQATESVLKRYDAYDPDLAFHMSLLKWVLTHNIFEFDGRFLRQLKGTAMGTPCAVAYANLVLFYIEESCLDSSPLMYLRYIDDLFVVHRSHTDAVNLVTTFNSKCSDIQLDAVTVGKSGIFLDLQFTIDSSRIWSSVYQKPMNRYLYIPPTSLHSISVFRNTIIAERKRYRLFCSRDSDFMDIQTLFYKRLRQRGFSIEMLNPLFEIHFDRSLLLTQVRQPKPTKRVSKPVISFKVPKLCQRFQFSKHCPLPNDLVFTKRYQAAFGTQSLVVGRRNFASLGQSLVFRPLQSPPPSEPDTVESSKRQRRGTLTLTPTPTSNPNPRSSASYRTLPLSLRQNSGSLMAYDYYIKSLGTLQTSFARSGRVASPARGPPT